MIVNTRVNCIFIQISFAKYFWLVAQYEIDTFLRGRFETAYNVSSHTAADEVVVVDSTLKPRRQRVEDIGL